MLTFPSEKNMVVLDVQSGTWRPELEALIYEHFPIREDYWSFLNLFYITSNGCYDEWCQQDIDELRNWWDIDIPDPAQFQAQVLAGEYELKREHPDFSVVIWCLQQKGLIAPIQEPFLIKIWW